MKPQANNLVSKVHPLTRALEPEDPMELVATPVGGDPDVMFECIVQEFVWMGWDADQLFELFRSPNYPVLNQLLGLYGEDQVRERIRELLGRTGTLRFREVIDDEPDPDGDDEPELTQLSVRKLERN